MRRMVVTGIAVAVLLAGCGSSGGNKSGSSSSSGSATTTTAAASSGADAKADKALAQSAVLTEADLPGYKATPSSDSGDLPPAIKKQFADCLGTDATFLDEPKGTQKADSPDFEKGQQQISAEVTVHQNASDFDKYWALFDDPKINDCLGKLFESAVKQSVGADQQVDIGDITVDRFDVAAGDKGTGFALKIPATAAGQELAFYVHMLYSQKGRAGASMLTFDIAEPVDSNLEQQLMTKMIDRIGDRAS